jgi:hypothetical protein
LCVTTRRTSPRRLQCSCAAPGERAPPCLIMPGWIDSPMGRVSVQFASSNSRSRRTDHFGISPQPSTTCHLEYGVSTVFPCGRRRRSIRTPTLPHGSTWPATVSHSLASVEDDELSMGVLLCGSLPALSRAGVTPHGKTAEAPYSKLGSRTAPDSDQRSRLVVLHEPSPAGCAVIWKL